MRKIRTVLFVFAFCIAFLTGNIATAHAATCPDFSKMSIEEFVRWSVSNPSHTYDGCNYFVRYNNTKKLGCYDYDWANASAAEVDYIVEHFGIVNVPSTPEFAAALTRRMHDSTYGWYETRKEEQLNALLKIQTEKMWKDSKLTGDDGSQGLIKNDSKGDVYSRTEVGAASEHYTVDGIVVGDVTSQTGKHDKLLTTILDAFGGLIYYVAEKLDSLLGGVGITLDTIIFGRVAGYGIKLNGGSPVALFSFELVKGNPYGFVAAVIFQRIRTFMYAFLSLLCLYRLIVVGVKGDYERMKMDFSDFLQSAFLSFSLIVLMPYMLDLYLYVRDILLKSITFQTLQELFGSQGFLQAFRLNAVAANKELVASFIYLAAVGVSIFLAGIYIAYAMSMMVHFILFPFVCLRGMLDRKVYGEWVSETVGLTIMPIIDGMILVIPLTFSQMANGNMAFNFLSLISCWMVLTARGQARRTLGVKDNGLDMKAIASVIGLGHMAKGIGNTVKKTSKKIGGAVDALKDAKADSDMAKYYDGEGTFNVAGAPALAGPSGGGGAGGAMPVPSGNAERHVNVRNFENEAFRGKLSNGKMAEMYRKRARANVGRALKETAGAVGTVGGGMTGGLIGAGMGAMAGSSMQMALAGIGMDAGSSMGGFAAERGADAAGLVGKAVGFAAPIVGKGIGKHFAKKDHETIIIGGPSGGAGGSAGGSDDEYVDVDYKDLGDANEVVPTRGSYSRMPDEPKEIPDKHPPKRIQTKEDREKEEQYNRANAHLNESEGRRRAYDECAADATMDAEDPSMLRNDKKMGENVADCRNVLENIAEDAESGKDNYDNLMKRYEKAHSGMQKSKVEHLKRRFQVHLELSTETGFDVKDQACQDARDVVMDRCINNNLSNDGRFMSDSFDKKYFGIDWNKYKRSIEATKNMNRGNGNSDPEQK